MVDPVRRRPARELGRDVQRLLGRLARGGDHRGRVVDRPEIVHRGATRVRLGRVREAADGQNAIEVAGTDRERALQADAERGGSRDRRDGRIAAGGAVARVDGVGRPAAPARADLDVGASGLPGLDLVGVREEGEGLGHRVAHVLRLVRRNDEGPDVGDDGELAHVVEVAEVRQVRMEPERLPSHRGRVVHGQHAALRDGERRPRRLVGSEVRSVEGNDHVVGVDAAVQEDADERPVVGGERVRARRREQVRQSPLAHRGLDRRRREGRAGRPGEEISSGVLHGLTSAPGTATRSRPDKALGERGKASGWPARR